MHFAQLRLVSVRRKVFKKLLLTKNLMALIADVSLRKELIKFLSKGTIEIVLVRRKSFDIISGKIINNR